MLLLMVLHGAHHSSTHDATCGSLHIGCIGNDMLCCIITALPADKLVSKIYAFVGLLPCDQSLVQVSTGRHST